MVNRVYHPQTKPWRCNMKWTQEQLLEACNNVLKTMEACENVITCDMRGSHAERQTECNKRGKPIAFQGLTVSTSRDYPVTAVYYPTVPGGIHFVKAHGQASKPEGR